MKPFVLKYFQRFSGYLWICEKHSTSQKRVCFSKKNCIERQVDNQKVQSMVSIEFSFLLLLTKVRAILPSAKNTTDIVCVELCKRCKLLWKFKRIKITPQIIIEIIFSGKNESNNIPSKYWASNFWYSIRSSTFKSTNNDVRNHLKPAVFRALLLKSHQLQLLCIVFVGLMMTMKHSFQHQHWQGGETPL